MQVIIQGLGLSEELRAEDDILDSIFFSYGFCIANRDRRLDNHQDIRVHLQRPLDGILNGACIKEMVHIVVVGRCGDDNQLGALVRRFLIRCRVEVQRSLSCSRLSKEPLDLIILDRADELIELFRLLLSGSNGCDFMLLGEQDGEA